MQLLINVLDFNVWLPKKEEEKNEGGKCVGPLSPLEVTSAGGEGAYHNG